MAGELLQQMADVKLLHVPYKSNTLAVTDLLGGQIDMMITDTATGLPQVKAGKLRAIGVSSAERSPLAPDVPTIAEAGMPGYDVSNWLGVLAPAGTRPDVLARLHAALGRAMATPALRAQLTELGIEPVFGTPEAFGALIRSEIPKWAAIVRSAGAKAD